MNIAYLLLGSNLGNRESLLAQALEQIDVQAGKIFLRSSVYNTQPWGTQDQQDFLNQAIAIHTELSAFHLLNKILTIEEALGRTRTHKWEARTIDIDILFYNSDIIDTPNLSVPHPFLHERKFALIPLAEIAGDFTHPTLNKSVKKLIETCSDPLVVTPQLPG